LLERLPRLDVTLLDLSRPMLDRASERVGKATAGRVGAIQGDIRDVALAPASVDIVLAAAVLHHLRDDAEWRQVFAKVFRALRPGGSLWIFDLVESSIPAVQACTWRQYGEYLTQFKDEAYRDQIFAYIEKEDTPRPLVFQLDLLREVGFAQVDILHKNSCFAAFSAVKGPELGAQDYKIEIDAELWAPGEWNPLDDNTDVEVRFADGSLWSASFFTYKNLLTLENKNRATGECLSGQYFWSTRMILIDEVSRKRIEQVVAELIRTGEFTHVFFQKWPQTV